MSSLKLGIVGATGLVGTEFLLLLEERMTPIEELRLFASERSKGNKISFRGQEVELQSLEDGCFQGLDVVFFSAGSDISKVWAPKAVQDGAFAIDNSSAFRMHPEVPLIVPEVNSHRIPPASKPSLIANPNCSTIQMLVALKPLKDKFGIQSIRVSTYQSVSGAGAEAVEELRAHSLGHLNEQKLTPKVFPRSIAFNNIPLIGTLEDNGFTDEEMKMIRETKKIFEDDQLRVSSFCVRTPSINGHSEAVWVELKHRAEKAEFLRELQNAPGIDMSYKDYPTNQETSGTNPVYVGRVHQDIDHPNTWMLWIVSDNIRKGAALNGLQIAESLFDKKDRQ